MEDRPFFLCLENRKVELISLLTRLRKGIAALIAFFFLEDVYLLLCCTVLSAVSTVIQPDEFWLLMNEDMVDELPPSLQIL